MKLIKKRKRIKKKRKRNLIIRDTIMDVKMAVILQHISNWIMDMLLILGKEIGNFHMYQSEEQEMTWKTNGYLFSQDRMILDMIFIRK